jgi:transcriptional regulator with XRE-family HTH domain
MTPKGINEVTEAQVKKLMTGAQFKKLVDATGLTRSDVARRIGTTPRTLRKYIAEELPLKRQTIYAVRWLASAAEAAIDPDTCKPLPKSKSEA